MIKIENLSFRYPRSDFRLVIENLQIDQGQRVAIVGPSGSGKTTLLNLVAGIVAPHSGQVRVLDEEVSTMTDHARRNFRIASIGFVFQRFELIDYLTARENILVPYRINRSVSLDLETKKRLEALAVRMGIADKLARHPQQLSQGEQQRVAICRALITQPRLILADEPTGNLDPTNKDKILSILSEESRNNRQTLVVVTHDMSILEDFDEVIDFQKFQQVIASREAN